MVKTPVVTTIHGFSSPAIIPVYEKYNKHTHYVSISDANRWPTLDYAATVYHGIDISQYTFRETPEDYLLFFGRIHPDKGTKEAIEAAQQAGKKLIIAGLIADQKYFDEQVQPHIDNDRVQYVGNVDIQEGNRLLGGAIALLHLIHFDEPFGLAVIEAMACGTPVIAISRGSLPELVSDGKTGFLITSAADAPAAITRLSAISRKACRQEVEQRFTVDRMVDGYVRVYEQILERRRHAAN
jgi:glycosyltransferase involved in cell wall biosynthesis